VSERSLCGAPSSAGPPFADAEKRSAIERQPRHSETFSFDICAYALPVPRAACALLAALCGTLYRR